VLGELLTAIVTPFHEDGSLDVEQFRALARHLVDHGSDGIVVAGTTGESPTLTDDEKLTLFAAAVDEVGSRATVVAGTGTYDTAHSVHLTARAHELGVDGFLVVTPYYNKPPQRGIVAHFRAIAEASDRPIVVYNIPSRVVVNIEPETISELAGIPSIAAGKQASADLAQARHIVEETDLALYAGDDNLVYPFLELGAAGGICVRTHIAGDRFRELVRLFRAGDAAGARRIHEELAPLFGLDAIAVNPIPIKTALNLLGHEVGGFRLPLVEATDAEREAIRATLDRVGLLQPAAA
jgi:4-hydroxy-tetrahydrodipicolinate synthase